MKSQSVGFKRSLLCVYPEECKKLKECIRPGDHDSPPPCDKLKTKEAKKLGKKLDELQRLVQDAPRHALLDILSEELSMDDIDELQGRLP